MIRIMLVVFFAAILFACNSRRDAAMLSEDVSELYDAALKPFYHGVASGDPLPNRVIIWTRVTPATAVPDVEGSWEISEYEDFHEVAARGAFTTAPSNDYTVKIDVQGLQPARHYYYRFHALDATSPTGRTKTAPAGDADSLKFAVVSCSNWEFGYFNAYACIADREVDAVLHLGDFIYEYGTGQYGDTTIGRTVLPPFEIISLRDYRTRYSQYRLDEGLRNLSARHPMISIWDDHEIANNSYSEGAQNHQDDEGPYSDRREAARKAYYEWLPIREGGKLYRSFNYGSLAEIIMLDERLEGRTRPPESTNDISYASPDQHMLGEEQLSWFETRLADSATQWKVIGNQVIFSEVDQSKVYPKSPRNLDSWDGYPAERKRIVTYIGEKQIDDIIFVTGDTHASWAFEVAPDPMHSYDATSGAGAIAVEFGTTSVSSANWDEYKPADSVIASEKQLVMANPHLKFGNARDHGYLLLSLYPTHASADWMYVNTLRKIDKGERRGMRADVRSGTNQVRLRAGVQ